MSDTFINEQKVKIQKKNDGGAWSEVARGKVVGFSQGKNNSFIRFVEFVDGKFSSVPYEFAEWICVSAPCIKVVKW